MGRYIKAILIAAVATAIASAIFGTLATIWYQNGISQRTVTAWVDAFLFLMAFTTPAALIIGVPVAAKMSSKWLPIVGLIFGTANGLVLTWLDDFFTGPGIDLKWTIYGAVDGALIGLAAFSILYAISTWTRSAKPQS